jgi:outer membrane protein
LLDLKSQLAADQLSMISAKNLIKSSYLALCQAMNTPYSENILLERLSAEDKFMGDYGTSKEQVTNMAEKNLAVIKAADLRIDAANWASTVAKGRLQPSVNMYGNISTRNSTTAPLDFKTQLSANLFKYLGLELTIPIFNGFQNKLRLQTATIGQKMAKVQSEGLRLQLSQAIEQAHLNMQNAHDRYKGLSIQSKALEQAFESTNMRFNAGNLNVLDFTIAKTNLDRAKLNLVQAQYEYIFRTKVLDFYQGKKLE